MLENNDESNHISIEEIKKISEFSHLTDDELKELQINLDSFCEIIYDNMTN